MSAASRQKTCAACGKTLSEDDFINIEVILAAGAPPHYIAVCWGESTFVHKAPTRKEESNHE